MGGCLRVLWGELEVSDRRAACGAVVSATGSTWLAQGMGSAPSRTRRLPSARLHTTGKPDRDRYDPDRQVPAEHSHPAATSRELLQQLLYHIAGNCLRTHRALCDPQPAYRVHNIFLYPIWHALRGENDAIASHFADETNAGSQAQLAAHLSRQQHLSLA